MFLLKIHVSWFHELGLCKKKKKVSETFGRRGKFFDFFFLNKKSTASFFTGTAIFDPSLLQNLILVL